MTFELNSETAATTRVNQTKYRTCQRFNAIIPNSAARSIKADVAPSFPAPAMNARSLCLNVQRVERRILAKDPHWK